MTAPHRGDFVWISFEAPLPTGLPIQGTVLADQVKSLDWKARGIEPAGKAPAEVGVSDQRRRQCSGRPTGILERQPGGYKTLPKRPNDPP